VIDELRGHYNPLTHDLDAPPAKAIDSESSHQVDMS
jgi:hypothetical protein